MIEAAVRVLLELRGNPHLGNTMRARVRTSILAECRKISFDLAGRRAKPRFRIVYRLEPEEGAPQLARVLAIGAREDLMVYRVAATRLGGAIRRGEIPE